MSEKMPGWSEIPWWYRFVPRRPHGDGLVEFDKALIAQNKAMSLEEKEKHIKWLQDMSERISGPGGP